MPRKKTTVMPENHTKTVNTEVIEASTKDFDELNKTHALLIKEFGNGLPYDEQRLDGVIYNGALQVGEGFYHMGCALILHKAFLPHGRFLEKIDNDFPFSQRRAQEMMQAARKFSGKNIRTFAQLGIGKMLELMNEKDEDLDELADGGMIAGSDIDDVTKMTRKELRAALRKERDKHDSEITSFEKLLESKDKKLNTLTRRTKNWDSRVKEFNQEATNLASSVLESLSRLEDLREAFLHEDFGKESEAADQAMGCVYYDAMKQIGGRTAQVMQDCDCTFGAYADQAMPMLEFWNEKMNPDDE